MPETPVPIVAIVDYGLGNIFSIRNACLAAGLETTLATTAAELAAADAVILPGVGAFRDAAEALRRQGLFDPLRALGEGGKPLVGICLGMQLLMERSHEFGTHEGLGILKGEVVRFDHPVREDGQRLKVPQVSWNHLHEPAPAAWAGTLLEGLPDGVFMYFVHSYCVVPEDPSVVLATTSYGTSAFCSVLRKGSVFACQCHPERSGPHGLQVYHTLARHLRDRTGV